MEKTTSSMRLLYAGLALWLAMVGCGLWTTSVNEERTESQSVSLDSATSADVRIELAAGELNVKSGSSKLMDASFHYNVDDWKPEVKYSESGKQGTLMVSQKGNVRLPIGGEVINVWELQFGNDVPMNLVIRTDAADSELDLGGLDLTSLTVETGVGPTSVNLNGEWQHDVNVSIRTGLGELRVTLPEKMGVRVDMDPALVNVTANGLVQDKKGYVNEAFGAAPHTLTLNLEPGVGTVVLMAP